MFKTKVMEMEYLITDDNGLMSGDKVIFKGNEEMIFADKRIESDGRHVYFFFKESEIVNSFAVKFHIVAFNELPPQGFIRVLDSGAYEVSKRNWSTYEFDNKWETCSTFKVNKRYEAKLNEAY